MNTRRTTSRRGAALGFLVAAAVALSGCTASTTGGTASADPVEVIRYQQAKQQELVGGGSPTSGAATPTPGAPSTDPSEEARLRETYNFNPSPSSPGGSSEATPNDGPNDFDGL